nr:LmeA family phospholipid-binding protein [Corynebacterium sp. sy017]
MAVVAEKAISDDVQHTAGLDIAPHVRVGGVPFSAGFAQNKLKEVSIGISDISVPTFGLVRANTVLTEVAVDRNHILNGQLEGSTAQLISRTIGLDAVAIGSLIGIHDLELSNPYDISPSGGTASEVQLRGTPAHYEKPVTVTASLRLIGSAFYLTPTTLIAGDEHKKAEIFKTFSLTFDTTTLPMGDQASYVYLSGGNIYFQSQKRNVTITKDDLSPIVSHPQATREN